MSTKLILVLILSVCTGGSFSGPLEGMKNFAALKMANYSNWLITNEMDPSPIFSKAQYFNASNLVANLSVTISNQGVRGHSSDITVKNITSSMDDFPINLHLITVDFETTGNVTFFGDYSLNGTVNLTTPISAQGMWHISVPIVYFNTCKTLFTSQNDTISSASTVENLHFGNDPVYDIFFENLPDNGGAVGLEDALFNGFAEYITAAGVVGWASQDPIKRLYMDYWTEVLGNTTLEEIYGTTIPSTSVKKSMIIKK